MRYSNGLLNFKNENKQQVIIKGEKGDQRVGFKLTQDGNYDIQNKSEQMLLMEQIQMMQTQNNNLIQLGMEQLQKISILVINILLRIQKREQDQNLVPQDDSY